MKKIIIISIIGLLSLFLAACNPSSNTISTTPAIITKEVVAITFTPTAVRPSATPTPSQVPPTQTATPIPIPSLPVSGSTPLPLTSNVISAANVNQLQEIGRYYGDIEYLARLTSDSGYLYIADLDGVTKYKYPSMEKLAFLSIPLRSDDFTKKPDSIFQITGDGNWVVINGSFLVDWRKDDQPKVRDLFTDFPYTARNYRYVTLSHQGNLLAIMDYCEGGCKKGGFWIVDLLKDSVLYEWDRIDRQKFCCGFDPIFSPDGTLLAMWNTDDNNTNASELHLWNVQTFEEVTLVKVKPPDAKPSSLAISDDNKYISVGLTTKVSVYSINTGDLSAEITDLCRSYDRNVLFLPNRDELLEFSDCDAGHWTVFGRRISSGWQTTDKDLSNLGFDERGSITWLKYPYNSIALSPYRSQEYFRFVSENVIAYKSFDAHTLDRYSCLLDLQKGSKSCSTSTKYESGGRYLGSSEILGTDGIIYEYTIGEDQVEIRSKGDRNNVWYSFPRSGYIVEINIVDPVNNLLFYTVAKNISKNKIIIQDITNNHIVGKWEGETFFDSITYSGDNGLAAICRSSGYNNSPFSDNLILFDTVQKKVTLSLPMSCSGDGHISVSSDSEQIAVRYGIRHNKQWVSKLLLLNNDKKFTRKEIDITQSGDWVVAFTPDSKLVAVGCEKQSICILDTSDGKEIYRFVAHSGISHLAFSKDGSKLATSSNWGLISIWAVPPFEYGNSQ